MIMQKKTWKFFSPPAAENSFSFSSYFFTKMLTVAGLSAALFLLLVVDIVHLVGQFLNYVQITLGSQCQ